MKLFKFWVCFNMTKNSDICHDLLNDADKLMDLYMGCERPGKSLDLARKNISDAYDLGANIDLQLNRLIELYRTSQSSF
jgi:hypothetical protein